MELRRRLLTPVVVLAVVTTGCGSSPASPSALVVEDVAETAGISATASTHGPNCVADLDADGELDLILNNHEATWPVMRGLGDGRFDRSDDLVLKARDRHSCTVEDFDGDGMLDIYFAIGACRGTCQASKELWIQQPDGTFVDEAQAWGIADPGARGRVSLALDVNGDGRPDLFTGAEEPVDFPSLSRVWLNRGDHFEPQEGPPANELGNLCATAGDIDGDGLDEIAVCTPRDGFHVYRNEDGAYVEATAELGLEAFGRRSAELADVDGDGRTDLVTVTKTGAQVYLNDDGRFSQPVFEAEADDATAVAFGDADGDGDLDLYVQEGGGTDQPDRLYLNGGDARKFTPGPVLPSSGGAGDAVQIVSDWRGSGRDAFLVNNGALDASGPRQLLVFTDP